MSTFKCSHNVYNNLCKSTTIWKLVAIIKLSSHCELLYKDSQELL